MNRETSLYLDAVRFLAALVVFMDHASKGVLTGNFLWQFRYFADEAVIVFFVLSGYVIAYVTDTRETSPLTYGVNRAARMYSVALPALCVTFILGAIGQQLKPELYPPAFPGLGSSALWQYFTAVTFTNALWTTPITPGANFAYWSMGYEVAYYVIFGLFLFSPARSRFVWVGLAMAVAGPPILFLFPTWLLGVSVYYCCKRVTLAKPLGLLFFAGSLVLWLGYEIWSARHGRILTKLGAELGDPVRPSLVADYLVALLFAMNLIGFHSLSQKIGAPLRRVAWPIRIAAGMTFSLYLLHQPVATFLRTLDNYPPENWVNRGIVIGGTLILVFGLSLITERRKAFWRWVIHSAVVRVRSVPSGQRV